MTDTTQAGWPVISTSEGLQPLDFITGRVLPGDVHTILTFLCQRFERLVEPIVRSESWGWSYRPVRGSTTVWSEHSAAVAIDLNASAHWIGLSDTFTDAQEAGIRQILAECGGVVVWGGKWASSRPDEMHFQLRHDPAEIKRIAGLIRKQAAAATAEPVKAQNRIGTRQGASIVQWLDDHGQDSSYAARATLARQYGIAGYVGSAEQNLLLLSLLRAGAAGKTYVVTSDGLNRRTTPGDLRDEALAYPGAPLATGMRWYGTGKTTTDARGGTWIEGWSEWQRSAGQPPCWVHGAHLKEVGA